MTLFDSDDQIPVDRGPGDTALMLAKLVAGRLPKVGPAATEIIAQIFGAPLQARRDDWVNDLAERLRALERRPVPITAEHLAQDPKFIDAVLTASALAVRTSQRTKRDALLNAVTNSALSPSSSIAQEQVFLALIDRFTDVHLAILGVFLRRSFPSTGPGYSHPAPNFLYLALPELIGREAFVDRVWAELNREGLVRTPGVDNGLEGPGIPDRLTAYGKAFLSFVSEP